jgi:hypothetical protein
VQDVGYRLAVPDHAAADHLVEVQFAVTKVLTQPASLAMPKPGQAIIIIRTKGRLRVANEKQF